MRARVGGGFGATQLPPHADWPPQSRLPSLSRSRRQGGVELRLAWRDPGPTTSITSVTDTFVSRPLAALLSPRYMRVPSRLAEHAECCTVQRDALFEIGAGVRQTCPGSWRACHRTCEGVFGRG
jgi:hypothetical protein